MNTLNFNQSVGFPLETNILDEMQTSWGIFNAFGALAGNFTIIAGCNTVGGTVGDGAVFINGELLKFKGGLAQDNVIIVEEIQALEFEDGNAHDVIYIRYATFGVATTQWPWSDFKRGFETKLIPEELEKKEDKATINALIERIEDLEARPASNIPIGLIAIWGLPVGDIPDGWIEYEDLRGRMPVGLKTSDPLFDTLLGYGGAKTKLLSLLELPKHFFYLFSNEIRGGAGNTELVNPNKYTARSAAGGKGILAYEMSEGNDAPTLGKSSEIGGDQPFSIMNPFRVVHFIQYVG
ncbi:hypothetical protein [Flavobacterium laiguense]|uniref:Phage tail collar domain-containing protein n=1 Tax=Flavobacterium laiguense TaxID=2169409 RepID=A0A2U1K1W8_9FLAO|nr:hypothetical protein [Flavobacterium laiguense]PWA10983.1 hypothetical protein DB891_03890 [Flavobacterium laiguense]